MEMSTGRWKRGYNLASALGEFDRLKHQKAHLDSKLLDSVHRGSRQTVQELLDQRADIHATRGVDQFGVMHLAAIQNHRDVAELLLQHRADPNAVDAAGRKPLFWSAIQGHKEMCTLLLPLTRERHQPDSDGESCMSRCRAIGGLQEIIALVEKADLDQETEAAHRKLREAHAGCEAAHTEESSMAARERVAEASELCVGLEMRKAHYQFKRCNHVEETLSCRDKVIAARSEHITSELRAAHKAFRESNSTPTTLAARARVLRVREADRRLSELKSRFS